MSFLFNVIHLVARWVTFIMHHTDEFVLAFCCETSQVKKQKVSIMFIFFFSSIVYFSRQTIVSLVVATNELLQKEIWLTVPIRIEFSYLDVWVRKSWCNMTRGIFCTVLIGNILFRQKFSSVNLKLMSLGLKSISRVWFVDVKWACRYFF